MPNYQADQKFKDWFFKYWVEKNTLSPEVAWDTMLSMHYSVGDSYYKNYLNQTGQTLPKRRILNQS